MARRNGAVTASLVLGIWRLLLYLTVFVPTATGHWPAKSSFAALAAQASGREQNGGATTLTLGHGNFL
jgi:hypothetical protein